VSFLLIEQEERFGGNHIWSFFDTDVEERDRWLIDPLVTRHWPEHDIRFPQASAQNRPRL
jgi:lycopene beta-cyclase